MGQLAIDALMLLAHETSSDKRRELLHAVTDLFLASDSVSDTETEMFDEVMKRVAQEAGSEGRRALSERIAPVGHAPRGIINQLARDDEMAVAGPVLKKSTVLTDKDLVHIAENMSMAHRTTMAERQSISSVVTDVLIRRGDNTVLRRVSGNIGAELSETGAQTLCARAAEDSEIQHNLCQRTDLPEAVAQDVQSRGDAIGKAQRTSASTSPIRSMLPQLVADFAKMSGLKAPVVYKMVLEERLDLLVIICKALDLDRVTFEDLLRYRADLAGGAVVDYGEMLEQYDKLSASAAQRMARFLKVRQTAA